MEKTEIVCRTGLEQCEVSQVSKVCSACRFSKCLAVGMKSDLLQVSCPLNSTGRSSTLFANIPDIGSLYDWGSGSNPSDSSLVGEIHIIINIMN